MPETELDSSSHVLVLGVGPADGVCRCVIGSPHLHLTTEADLRLKAVVDAMYDAHTVSRLVTSAMNEMERSVQARFEEFEDAVKASITEATSPHVVLETTAAPDEDG